MAEMYGAVPLSGPLNESVADGVILVGDAARHVKIEELSTGALLLELIRRNPKMLFGLAKMVL